MSENKITPILVNALRGLNDKELSHLRDAIDERLPEGLRLQSHADRLAEALEKVSYWFHKSEHADCYCIDAVDKALSEYKHFKEKQR